MVLTLLITISIGAMADIGPKAPCPRPPVAIPEASAIKARNEKPPAPIDTSKVPAWLNAHVGDGPDQINKEVLRRAREFYAKKFKDVKNACYIAMDATRPHLEANAPGANPEDDPLNATIQNRAYLICESMNLYVPISSSHGSGTEKFYDIKKGETAKVYNERTCARYFGNAPESLLTTGGGYLTGEVQQSFKGRQVENGRYCDHTRPFLVWNGEPGTDTENALPRDLGAHAAVLTRKRDAATPDCWCEDVYYGAKVNYPEGRSNGCIAMKEAVAEDVIPLFEGHPSTVYIYPESKDIAAINAGDKNTYWNKACLGKIQNLGGPKFIRMGEYSQIPKTPGQPEPPKKEKTLCAPNICVMKPFENGRGEAPGPTNSSAKKW